MTTNHHQFNTLGRSHQDEDAMVCDCSFRPGTSTRLNPPGPFPLARPDIPGAAAHLHAFVSATRCGEARTDAVLAFSSLCAVQARMRLSMRAARDPGASTG